MNESEQEKPTDSEGNTPLNPEKPNSIKKVIVLKGDKDRPTKAEWILITITLILAIFNYFTLKYASNQSSAALDAVRVADSQFVYQRWRDSINSFNQNYKDSLFAKSQHERDSLNFVSIELTKQSIKFAGENARTNLRPYVVIDEDSIITLSIGVNRNILVSLITINVGKTPAIDFFHTNICRVVDVISQQIFDGLNEQVERHKKTGVVVGSHLTFPKDGIYGVLSLKDSIDVFTEKKKLVFAGIISYGDVFGGRHLTWYSMEYNVKRNKWISVEKYNGMN